MTFEGGGVDGEWGVADDTHTSLFLVRALVHDPDDQDASVSSATPQHLPPPLPPVYTPLVVSLSHALSQGECVSLTTMPACSTRSLVAHVAHELGMHMVSMDALAVMPAHEQARDLETALESGTFTVSRTTSP